MHSMKMRAEFSSHSYHHLTRGGNTTTNLVYDVCDLAKRSRQKIQESPPFRVVRYVLVRTDDAICNLYEQLYRTKNEIVRMSFIGHHEGSQDVAVE